LYNLYFSISIDYSLHFFIVTNVIIYFIDLLLYILQLNIMFLLSIIV